MRLIDMQIGRLVEAEGMLEMCSSLKHVPSFIHSTNAVAFTCFMSKPCFQQGCCAGVHDSIMHR